MPVMIRVIVFNMPCSESDRSDFNQTFNQVKRDTVTLILAAATIVVVASGHVHWHLSHHWHKPQAQAEC